MSDDEELPTGADLKTDEDLTTTVEEQLAAEEPHDDEQTRPLSSQDLQDPAVEPLSEEELRQENAATSLDQPSDSTS